MKLIEKPTYEELEQRVLELEKTIDALNRQESENPSQLPDHPPETLHEINPEQPDLKTIIDVPAIQNLLNDFYSLTNIGVAILDLKGNVLVANGWQDICTKFHRIHPETLKNCIQSDIELSEGVKHGSFRRYRCKNNMWDIATPIVVGNLKLGNLYLGQFLFEDESPDREVFLKQAKKYGFDEKKYMAALEKVPRWSHKTVDTVMNFYIKFAHMISDLGHKNVILKQSLEQREEAINSLNKSEAKYRELVENMNDVLYSVDVNGMITYISPPVETILGYPPPELVGKDFMQFIHPDDREEIHQGFTDVLAGNYYPSEYRILAKNGDFRWVRTSSHRVTSANQTAGFQGVLSDIHGRKKAEKNLVEALEWYQEIFNGSRDAIFISNENARLVAVNNAACHLTGYSAKALLSMKITDLCDKTDLQEFQTYHSRIMSGDAVTSEARILRKDGIKIDTEFSNKKITVSNISYMHTTARDIRERKRADEKIRLLNQRFEIAADSAGIGVWDLDLESNALVWDKWMYRLYGIDEKDGDIAYETWKTAVHPHDLDRVEKNVQSAILGDKPFDTQFRIVRPDGEVRHIRAFALVIRDNGKPIKMTGVNYDITDQKMVEHALKESEKNHRTIIQTAMDGFFLLDRDGNLLEVNDAYCKISGYSRKELLNKNVADLEANERPEETDAHRKNVLKNGFDRFETRHKGKNGRIIDIEVSVQYQSLNRGLYFAFLRDITERKSMERQIQKTQKMEAIGSLAGGIAHDFNNILFPIVGMAELLLEDLAEGSLEHENAKVILDAGKRGSDLVKQILAFSRQSDHHVIPVRVQSILKEVLRLCRSTIPSDIQILHDIQNDCQMIMADPTQIHQIAMDLITNAYHAVESKAGTISVVLKEIGFEQDVPATSNLKDGRFALLTVSDTGCGIKPSLMDKIFEPYFTTKQQGKGTGLGLAVVYGIVRELGGDIIVSSNLGVGTTFDVYFPLMEMPLQAAPADTYEKIKTGSESILLVDDEESIVQLEKKMLERLGYQVTHRFSSIDALKAFKANPDAFDLVITDMNMPNMTGDHLARELISVRNDIPVILCTGFSERISRTEAEAIGIKGFLMKPVIRSKMAESVRQVLDDAKNRSDAEHKTR